jgi:hypothetical protein
MEIPQNEMGVVVLFAQFCVGNPDLEIISIGSSFPDAIVRWKGQEYSVEFEYKSVNFSAHDHDPVSCDFIICWEDNDPCPILPIVALSEDGWMDREMALTPNTEKLASYWKRRAIEAEIKLNSANSQAYSSKDLIIKDRILATTVKKRDQDDLFAELVNSGASRNQAAFQAFGRSYAGDLVQRGRRALGEIRQRP